MCGSPFSPSSELWSATSCWIVLVGTWNWRARGDSSMRIAYVTYRSRKTPVSLQSSLMLFEFSGSFWAEDYVLMRPLGRDMVGHGGAKIRHRAQSQLLVELVCEETTGHALLLLRAQGDTHPKLLMLVTFFEQTESWCRCFKMEKFWLTCVGRCF